MKPLRAKVDSGFSDSQAVFKRTGVDAALFTRFRDVRPVFQTIAGLAPMTKLARPKSVWS
jgi:hypothetical protein